MSDLLLGVIIGGVIGLVGAWIQGCYSLKGKREENLARQQQQSMQIQHEKHSELISRIIEVRARSLDPLSDQLGKLHTSMSDFQDKLLSVIVQYLSCLSKGSEMLEVSEITKRIDVLTEVEIQVEAAKKQEFIQRLKTVEGALRGINTLRTRIQESCVKATNMNLRGILHDLVGKVYSLGEAYYKMKVDLERSTTGHDFTYDFELILRAVRDVDISISHTNRRIESLLAGADAGDE